MKTVYVGLDVGSSTCHLVAIDAEGSELVNRKFDTGEKNLIAVFEEIRGEVHACLEASELAGWIRDILKPRVKRVVVADPKTNAWIARDPHKKDKVDAKKLAHLLRMGEVHEVYYEATQDRRDFKQVVRHYDDLTRQETELKQRIKARFRVQGVIPRGLSVYGPRGRETWLARLSSAEARVSIEQLYSVLDKLLAVREEARKQMERLARAYPEVGRFDKVPGVGSIGACRFSAYIQTPHRFSAKRKLWRYCAMAVTDRSSDGKPLGKQCLDRGGNLRLKEMSRAAFIGATRSRNDNAFKRTFAQVLKSTKDRTHARLTTQRKILAVLWAMWRNGSEYQDDLGKVR